MILSEKAPELIRALGEALEAAGRGTFGSIAAPLGSIDNLSVYDSGGNGDGKNALQRVTDVVPGILFNFLQKCKANGMGDLENVVSGAVKFLASMTEKDTGSNHLDESQGAGIGAGHVTS